ncbi:unnamed protein product [Vitrella brassicaformis CCMP3155]|uniref:Uncharacterized protein n=1 Tax=Vitrella brassicaformis (strain CCMP3155) TaxID=1169540 RepID=A0A0G4EZH4_VITBC|nr:unnamed protein product [Vitrella brassicaformis CCMP3155]|eukprot:CEM04409.1 unnamed protein product [Vitrella brassicaformis CCMP3155]
MVVVVAVVEHIIATQMQQPEQQQQEQQHPFSYIFVGRRTFYLFSSIKDILRLRATSTWLRDLFGAAQLRDRLRHSLGSQAGLRRAVNGRQVQLLRFDDDQFGTHDLLAAVCVVEEGPWDEIGEVIELAGQCGNCDLPVILTSDDINTHTNKSAYVSAPRVLAQLKMVGRHVQFGDDSCLQLFQDNGEVRAIKDQPGFRLTVDPPLPAGHLYQQHRQPHDPPVHESIIYSLLAGGRWVSIGGLPFTAASVSSFAKAMVLDYFGRTHKTHVTSIDLNRNVGGGRLDDLLTESPHTPVAGCTTTLGLNGNERLLVLTNNNHNFVAWISIADTGGTVDVIVYTTEAAVCGSGPFKHRFPLTTQLARVALAAVAPYFFDGQVQQQQQQQQQQNDDSDDSDDGDDEGDDMDDGSGEGSGGDEAAAEGESSG